MKANTVQHDAETAALLILKNSADSADVTAQAAKVTATDLKTKTSEIKVGCKPAGPVCAKAAAVGATLVGADELVVTLEAAGSPIALATTAVSGYVVAHAGLTGLSVDTAEPALLATLKT